jgi:hypothetical protein
MYTCPDTGTEREARPCRAVGYKQPAEGGAYVIDLMIDLYFYFDILFNFVTGYEAGTYTRPLLSST